ncbi:hypothetical protein [Deinococcus kurensis]|uniref:hypothetical protein n=1 Tax=Deinococcus kurensis TaxID=2662757 RepID=UPI0012D33877|nr:hypothetical protein [Deinococcus kurensis]
MTPLSPAEFRALSHPAQRRHLRALARVALSQQDASGKEVKAALDEMAQLCAVLDEGETDE